MLRIERGVGSPDSQAFADVDFAREYATGRWGMESLSGENHFQDEQLESALWAAAEYMNNIPWYGITKNVHQALSWPRYLIEPEHYQRHGDYGFPQYGWYSLSHNWSHRYCVPSDVVPEEVRIANVLLAKDILEGNLDPTGFHKPVVATSASSEAGSLSFHRPQALSNKGGMRVRTRDPLYAVRRLIRPWLHRRVPSAKFVRS